MRVIVSLVLVIVSVLTTSLKAQDAPLVRLEPLGPSEIVSGQTVAKDLIRKRRQFLLTNVSEKNIIVYVIMFSYEPDHKTGGKTLQKHYSYPPGPPALPAGASTAIYRQYVKTPQRSEVNAIVDFILFDDGSTFGPDISGTGATYRTMVETQRLTWRAALNMLEQRGPEATKAFIREKLSHPNPIEKRRPGIR